MTRLLLTCLVAVILGAGAGCAREGPMSTAHDAPVAEAFLRLRFAKAIAVGEPLTIMQDLQGSPIVLGDAGTSVKLDALALNRALWQ